MEHSNPSRRRWLAPGLIVLATVLIYSHTLDVPYYLDDEWNLLTNPSIRNWRDVFSVLTPPVGDAKLNLVRRPFINVTYAFNYALGGLRPAGYHVFNIIVHALNGLLFFILLRRVLRGRGQDPALAHAAPVLAALAALWWTAHPLNTVSVNYINMRNELLVAFFAMVTLYALHRTAESRRPLAWKALAVGSCGLGMACKEVMVGVPILALVFDRVFLAESWRDLLRRRKGFYAGLFSTWGLLFVFMLRDPQNTWGQQWWPYLLTQAWALNRYLKLAFWPHPLVFDYGRVLIQDPAIVWIHGLVVIGLIGLTAALLARAPGFGFLGLAFFLILAPSSSINPVLGQTIGEHRMYLPLTALVTAAVLAGWWFTLDSPSRRRALALALLLAIPAYGIAARMRSSVYRDPVRLWADNVAKWPACDRAHDSLGVYLMEAGRFKEAAAEFEATLKLNPHFLPSRYNLALVYQRMGHFEQAVAAFKAALAQDTKAVPSLGNLARLLLALDRADEALPLALRAVQLRPGSERLQILLGDVLYRLGRTDEALEVYSGAAEGEPPSDWARLLRLAVLLETGRIEASAQAVRGIVSTASPPVSLAGVAQRLVRLNRTRAALVLLAPYWETGDPMPVDLLNAAAWYLATTPEAAFRDGPMAIRLAERAARETGSSDPVILDTLAAAYAESGRYDEAARNVERAADVAMQRGASEAASELRLRADLYRRGKPFRAESKRGLVPVHEMIPLRGEPNGARQTWFLAGSP